MFDKYRRRWQLAKVRPGDGSPLRKYHFWQWFSRSLFALDLTDPHGRGHLFEVDVRYYADGSTKASPAALYRDGIQIHRATIPVTFAVPGGVIEVAKTPYGLKRMHYVTADGREHMLHPHPRSHEGLRARFGRRFPRLSRAIGTVAVIVLLAGLAVALPKILELVTHSPVIAAQVGTFVSPIQLPTWASVTLTVAGACAALERALTLRNHWLIDMNTST